MVPFVTALVAWQIYIHANPDKRPEYVFTCVAGGSGIIYFLQKQKLEECKLFGDYFFRFNQEYLKQSQKLDQLFERTINEPAEFLLCPEDILTLHAYFDLCSEEFFFWKLGRIHVDAWTAWRTGIKYFLSSPRILKEFRSQMAEGSYYGLTEDIINF